MPIRTRCPWCHKIVGITEYGDEIRVHINTHKEPRDPDGGDPPTCEGSLTNVLRDNCWDVD